MMFLEPTQADGGMGAGLGPYAKGEGVDSIRQPSRVSDSVSHMVGRLLSILFVRFTSCYCKYMHHVHQTSCARFVGKYVSY